jgi:Flp pilus assembly protein TadD
LNLQRLRNFQYGLLMPNHLNSQQFSKGDQPVLAGQPLPKWVNTKRRSHPTRSPLQFGGIVTVVMLALNALLDNGSVGATAVTYRQRGLFERDQGRLPAAIANLQKAVELDPTNLSGRVNLGWTLHLARQDRAAADALQQNIVLDPFHVPTLNALGIVYLVNNDLAAAVVTHTWATLLAPDNEIPHYNLSLAFERLQSYDSAIASAEKAVALEPDNPHPLVALAIARWGNREKVLAQENYQQAIALDSRYNDRSFLESRAIAGLSADQIAIAKQVQETLSELAGRRTVKQLPTLN